MKQTLKLTQPQNCLPKFFAVRVVRTTASSPQSHMGAPPRTLEPPCCPQLLQDDDDGPRDMTSGEGWTTRKEWTRGRRFLYEP